MKSSLSCAFIVAVFVLMLGFAPLLAKSILEVRIVDADGKALEKVEVFAQGLRSGKIKNEDTNREGIATFNNMDDDYYRVWAKEKGYAPGFKEFIKLSDDAKQSIEIMLTPGNEDSLLYFEDNSAVERGNELLREGAEALIAKNYDEAEKKLKAAVEANPSQYITYQNLAILYSGQQKWDLAEENAKKAVELAQLYVDLQEDPNPALQKQYEQLKQLLDTLPLQKTAAAANAAMKEGKYDEAVERFRELLQVQPENSSIHYNMAIALARDQKLPEAQQAIDKAIELSPENQDYQTLKSQLGKLEEAQEFDRFREQVAEIEQLYKDEQYEQVLTRSEELRARAPKDLIPALWLLTGRANARLGHMGEARSGYEKAIELSSDPAGYRKELAEYLLEEEDYPEAFSVLIDYWKATSAPVDESLFKLAQGLIKDGKQQHAKLALEKVLEINPQFAEAYYELGMEYFYGSEDREQARKMLEKYVELGEDEAHLNNAQSVLVVIEKGL